MERRKRKLRKEDRKRQERVKREINKEITDTENVAHIERTI